jgi:ATP-dependent DNA ligase
MRPERRRNLRKSPGRRINPSLPADIRHRHPPLFSEHRPEHGIKLFKEAEKRGLEGAMGKRAMSLYRSGSEAPTSSRSRLRAGRKR